MPFRKDHLQLVTDAGPLSTHQVGLRPASLDPINGVDVDVADRPGA